MLQRHCILLLLWWSLVSITALNAWNGQRPLTQPQRVGSMIGANRRRNELSVLASSQTSTSAANGAARMQSEPSAEQAALPRSTTTRKPSSGSIIRELSTPAEFFDVISMSPEASGLNIHKDFLLVNYHANYCKQCHRTHVALKKLVQPYQDDFDFVRVEVSVLGNDSLKKLGIHRFPFLQIYYQGWCVASFSTGSVPVYAFHKLVSSTLDQCRLRIRSPEAWQTFFQQFEIPIRDTARALDELRPTLLASTSSSSSSSSDL